MSTTIEVIKDLREYLDDGGLRLNLHAGQKEAWNSKARFIAIVSGTQGGKTSFSVNWLLREIRLCGPGDYIYASPTYKLMLKKALPEFREVFEHRGKLGYFKPSEMAFVFNIAGMDYIHGRGNYDLLKPTTVFFGHAQNPESLESATAKAAVLDEAGQTQFKLESWEAILRRLAIHRGRVLLPTTPYNLGWLYREFYLRWKDKDPDYHVVNFPSTMNPRFPKEELERAKRTLPKWKYDMFYLGLFTRPAGMIYDCFNDEDNVIKPFPIPLDYKRVFGLDFGGINTAAVKHALHPMFPLIFQYAEYYPQKMRKAAEHACFLLEHEPHAHVNWKKLKVDYDTSIYKFVGGSLSESQWRLEFASAGMIILPTIVREVEIGISRVYAEVKQRHLKIFDTCKYTLSEFGSYARPLDENGDPIPDKIENQNLYHLLDATRYDISHIVDPTAGTEWTQSDIAKLDPDGKVDWYKMLIEEEIDPDDPRVAKYVARLTGNVPKTKAARKKLGFETEDKY